MKKFRCLLLDAGPIIELHRLELWGDFLNAAKLTLAFLFSQDGSWKVCAADKAVYRVLGYLGRGEQGISLEEIFRKVGLSRTFEWRFTEQFQKKYTSEGKTEGIQRGRIH